jgi:hypothetical protein
MKRTYEQADRKIEGKMKQLRKPKRMRGAR